MLKVIGIVVAIVLSPLALLIALFYGLNRLFTEEIN